MVRGPFWLSAELSFPPVEAATPDGLLALGGDLSPRRLLLAYRQGIFPWYSAGQPILWWSPDPRFALLPERLHLPRTLRQAMRRAPFRVTLDEAFEEVIHRCSATPRAGQRGTWITDAMIDAYLQLHRLGYAHSVEAWRGEELVGGLYGVSLGRAYFGESMFHSAPEASKIAFALLAQQLIRWEFTLIDCQMETAHLARFGAESLERGLFLERLEASLSHPTRPGPWRFDGEHFFC